MSSSKYPERWIVPGGGVEQDETNAETAVRELLEEAGVVGRLGRCLGVFEVSCGIHRTISSKQLTFVLERGTQTPDRSVCINCNARTRRVGRLQNDRTKATVVLDHRRAGEASPT